MSKICPECGADMTNLDPKGHALSHWPERIEERPDTAEARKRQAQVLDGGVEAEEES